MARTNGPREPRCAHHVAMDYTFDNSVLTVDSESTPASGVTNTQAEESATHISTNVSHSQEALKSAKMIELVAKCVFLWLPSMILLMLIVAGQIHDLERQLK